MRRARRLRTEQPADFGTVDARQVEVEDEQVRGRGGNGGQGGRPRRNRLDLDPAAALKGMFDEIGDVGFVFHDQDSREFSRHQSHG